MAAISASMFGPSSLLCGWHVADGRVGWASRFLIIFMISELSRCMARGWCCRGDRIREVYDAANMRMSETMRTLFGLN